MDRLTETFEENGKKFACIHECKNGCIYGWTEEDAGCRCDKFDEMLERLATIEDILGDDYDLNRLKVIVNQCMTMREEVSQRFSLTAKIPIERLKELVETEMDL